MKKVLYRKVIETCKKCEYYYPLSHSCSYNNQNIRFDENFNAYWHIHEKCPLPDYIEEKRG